MKDLFAMSKIQNGKYVQFLRNVKKSNQNVYVSNVLVNYQLLILKSAKHIIKHNDSVE